MDLTEFPFGPPKHSEEHSEEEHPEEDPPQEDPPQEDPPQEDPPQEDSQQEKGQPPSGSWERASRLTGSIQRRLSEFEQDLDNESAAEVTAKVIETSDEEPPQAQPKRVKLRVTSKKKRTFVMASQWKTKKPSRQATSSSEEGVQETVQEQAVS
ncbi:hypothetical protein QBC36DRAFT_309801 [Triangularia setosa]|uniref:Uncharacterized protein n=1 Tax=Triangularia setosa TaxID=2587417 RepID=A0AAN7A899_9PEZI|nr:hypothetical protein QBC36DRAFT_309801 [Podospora setosa]